MLGMKTNWQFYKIKVPGISTLFFVLVCQKMVQGMTKNIFLLFPSGNINYFKVVKENRRGVELVLGKFLFLFIYLFISFFFLSFFLNNVFWAPLLEMLLWKI